MNNFFCAAPWRGLHINPRGDVKTCCAGDANMLGNLNDKSITDILDGPMLREIRSSLKQGLYHPFCLGCKKREDRGADSERNWHNTINDCFDHETAGIDYQYPTMLDIRWNSTCNLSCNYCGPMDSSKWAALKKIPINNNTRNYYIEVCEFIANHNQHIKEVALIGGEPLLLPENAELLDVIPEDVILTVITNLNSPLESNKIFQKLSRRHKVGWSMSFDNIGERFEYVRHGADWNLQLKNLDIIQDLMANQGHWGGIHALYNIYNSTRLVEFKNFAQERNLSIKWQILGTPTVLDTRNYPRTITNLAREEILRMFEICQVNQEEQHMFSVALKQYQSDTPPGEQMLIKLKHWIDEIETYHPDQQGKFHQLWPEISRLL